MVAIEANDKVNTGRIRWRNELIKASMFPLIKESIRYNPVIDLNG